VPDGRGPASAHADRTDFLGRREGRRDCVTAARTSQVEDVAVSRMGSWRWTRVLAEWVMRPSEPPCTLAERLQESGAVSAHGDGIGCSSDTMKKVRHAVVPCPRGGDRGSPLGCRPNRARPRAGACRRQRSRALGEGARLPGPEANARRAVQGPAGWQAVAHATRRQIRRRASLRASRRSQVPAAKPVSAASYWLSADGCTATRVNSTRDLMPILRDICAGDGEDMHAEEHLARDLLRQPLAGCWTRDADQGSKARSPRDRRSVRGPSFPAEAVRS
jgi:hypothetical protein